MENVGNILSYFNEELNNVSNQREITSWAYISIKHILGLNRSQCIIHNKRKISKNEVDKFVSIVSELKTSKPLQYILEETFFYGLKFRLNRDVLIPRPETEELVEWILDDKFSSVLDIGTGSGCIAISIAKNTKAKVSAIDVSNKILDLAKLNAKNNNVDIDFMQKDIFEVVKFRKYDLIVSNPPYVLNSDKYKLNKNIFEYEPDIALYVNDIDPTIFYNQISLIASKSLSNGGKLFFEINEKFSKKIITILKDIGFVNIQLKKDINDKDRMIKAIWK